MLKKIVFHFSNSNSFDIFKQFIMRVDVVYRAAVTNTIISLIRIVKIAFDMFLIEAVVSVVCEIDTICEEL